jgi:LDH2 family malate/lactate/ureidoglycolate dehydrogenase
VDAWGAAVVRLAYGLGRAAVRRVRDGRPRAGVDRLYAPGDLENEPARRHLEQGIAYERFVVDDLRALAAGLAIPFWLDPAEA